MDPLLAALLEQLAAGRRAEPILHDGAGPLGAGALAAAARALAARLAAAGLRPGEVLALGGLAPRETLVALLGGLAAGAVVFPLNTREPGGALERQLAEVGAARAFVADPALAARLGGTADLGAAPPPRPPLPGPLPPRPPLPAGAATILATSGSSGRPKYVVHSLSAYAHAARRAASALGYGPGATWRLSLPLFHVGGLGVLMRALFAGGAVETPPASSAPWEGLGARGVTHLSLVPTQLLRALKAPGGAEELRALGVLLLGGAALSATARARALAAGLPLRVSYGSTESTGLVTLTRDAAEAGRDGCAGPALEPGTVAVDAQGEVRLAGASLFLGYLEPAGLRTARDPDGSFATGDLGRLDEAGRLFVLGRRDRMFVSGGENVFPEEVERALLALPGVHEARVEARPDPTWGQVPVAFVRADPDLDLATLAPALRERLPGFKVPRWVRPLRTPPLK